MGKIDILDYEYPAKYTRLENVPVGPFVGAIGSYCGLFWKTYKSIIFLKDPTLEWYDKETIVDNYRQVDLEIKVAEIY